MTDQTRDGQQQSLRTPETKRAVKCRLCRDEGVVNALLPGQPPVPCPRCVADGSERSQAPFTSKERTRRGHIMVLREILHHGTVETGAWEAAIRYAIHKLELQSPDETSERPTQAAVLQWALDSFGTIALNRDERAARLVEEAMEVAQAEGVPAEVVQRILARVYSRPPGELGQEIGGCGITLLALAENARIDHDAEVLREWRRVLSKPRDWWQRKHAEKVAARTANLSPTSPLKANAVPEYEGPQNMEAHCPTCKRNFVTSWVSLRTKAAKCPICGGGLTENGDG